MDRAAETNRGCAAMSTHVVVSVNGVSFDVRSVRLQADRDFGAGRQRAHRL